MAGVFPFLLKEELHHTALVTLVCHCQAAVPRSSASKVMNQIDFFRLFKVTHNVKSTLGNHNFWNLQRILMPSLSFIFNTWHDKLLRSSVPNDGWLIELQAKWMNIVTNLMTSSIFGSETCWDMNSLWGISSKEAVPFSLNSRVSCSSDEMVFVHYIFVWGVGRESYHMTRLV